MVVLVTPLRCECLHLPEGIEELLVQEFVPKLAVEALNIPLLPRATRCDEEILGLHALEPQTHLLCGELPSVVRADVIRHTPLNHDISQALNDMG